MSQEDAHVGRQVTRMARITQSDAVDLTTTDYAPPWVPDKLYVGLGSGFTVVGRLLGDAVDRTFWLEPGFHDMAFTVIRKAGSTWMAGALGLILVLRSTD